MYCWVVLLSRNDCIENYLFRPNKKRSLLRLTRPTVFWSADRTLFFRLRVRYFLVPLRAWPVASSIATAREKSKGKKQAKGLGKEILTVTQAFEPRSRCVKRCATQYSIDATRFLSAAANRASYSLLATACFNFETDISAFFFLIFWLIRSRPANQLFLVYDEANGSICQVPCGQEAFFAEDVFCTWTRMQPCSRCCGLRLEITSLWISHIAF